jgi:hypothetical protein
VELEVWKPTAADQLGLAVKSPWCRRYAYRLGAPGREGNRGRVTQRGVGLGTRSPYGSTFPGFMIPAGSIAALIRCISANSAPPRQSGIM